ncbi:hypothetical protein HF324_09215 [Chitinophaga oryzae]|uniref:Uncharacterized protein n=1 Tax=Chitinophaga oryzae TaxID=2725414 RepID=A0ABX6LD29_9BACT|nr:hypothetical protein [Chitinophaga oryzae]QJB38021.1 hypothetical protein HF324_09215 [Chitinophaga oryzae]
MANLTFDYSFQPSEIFTNSVVDLNLYVTNNTNDTIEFEGGPNSDEIHINFPQGSGATKLVTNVGFTANSDTKYFSCAKSASDDDYVITATMNVPIPKGGQIHIIFLQVPINDTPGTAPVTFTEYLGSADPATGTRDIVKTQPAALSIMAYLQQQVVGLGQTTTLTWYSTGATRVVVTGFATGDKQRTFAVQGDRPPYKGSCIVDIAADLDSTTYTLIAYNGNGNSDPSVQTYVVLYHGDAKINSFVAYKTDDLSQHNEVGSEPLAVDQPVTLYWYLTYASRWQLKPPGKPLNNPITPRQVTPGMELVQAFPGNYSNMPATSDYKLTAFGFKDRNPSQTISFKLKPVGIGYFKFKDPALTQVVWQTDPADWLAVEINIPAQQPYTFTIWQPGGKFDVYYLGSNDTHPQIQYFDYTKVSGDQYKLSWITANLTSLTLNPGNISITGDQIKNGSQTLKLEAAQYRLTGLASDGSKIDSVLNVPYTGN